MPTPPSILVFYNDPVLPRDHPESESEADVLETVDDVERVLTEAGFDVRRLGAGLDPQPLLDEVKRARPDAVFNLFEGVPPCPGSEVAATALLEWLGLSITGCPSACLSLSRDKAASKHLFAAAGLPTAKYMVLDGEALPDWTHAWPAMVKPARQDASVGIDQGSVVTDSGQLAARVRYVLDRFGPPVVVEEYIGGREFHVNVIEEGLGSNRSLTVLPFAEIAYRPARPDWWPVYTYTAKWDMNSAEYIDSPLLAPVELPPDQTAELAGLARRAFRLFGCRDFARIDVRMNADGEFRILEMNPNPYLISLALVNGLEAANRTHEQLLVQMTLAALARGGKEVDPATLKLPAEDVRPSIHENEWHTSCATGIPLGTRKLWIRCSTQSPARRTSGRYNIHSPSFAPRGSIPRPPGMSMGTLHPLPHTRVPTVRFPSAAAAAKYVAKEFDKLIRARNAAMKPTVLGLATGSTPVGLYRELIRLHRDEGLDFSRVVTFNLDEYFPMPKEDSHSYFRWMHETFFNHVNIPAGNIHIPDGTLHADDVDAFCTEYEKAIKSAGGIDMQVLGIGRTGHIGFNEPGSPHNSRTRIVTLDSITRRDAASGFFGEENVPNQAITMGVASILDARRVFLMAFGEHKASIVYKAIEQPPTEAISASFLQEHPDATVVLDEAAAAELTAIKRPWEVGACDWTPELVCKAVVNLALTAKKGLQKLNDDDFRDHHLYELLREKGPAQRIGQTVFDDRMATIIPFPSGRVGPENAPKTVLVFSPHPDDDVISMGGTLIRLVEQGHTVHVAYMTSGNIAVFDHDARRFVDFVDEFLETFGTTAEKSTAGRIKERVCKFLDLKKSGEADSDEVLKIKGQIRAAEARAAALACGIPPERLEFMDLRFYRTGTAAKDPIHEQDIADIAALLVRLAPHQIYVAGELSDPHGTHRVCAEAVFAATRAVRASGLNFDVWLYKGAWEEWEPHEIEMAVPLSPEVLERKKQAIFRHQSQKDRAMFPGGTDRREFWQRAEDRNLGTARTYDELGLPEYYSLEAFVRWKDE